MKVIVYGTSTCPYCDLAKDFLKENNVVFEYFNVGENAEKAMEMREKSGQLGVPVIEINGKIIVGFDKEAIKKELKLK